MKRVRIEASVPYDVLIGEGLLAEAGGRIAALGGAEKVILVSDDGVYPLYGEALRASLEGAGLRVFEFVFPRGESQKTLATCGALLEAMCAANLRRGDLVAALGGGVTGDLAGFAAAVYRRGIRFVQLPTTLLAAVDASVGGKTAVNLPGGKNQAGAFHQPALVLCDTALLVSLPETEIRSGCAEIVKTAMVGSEALFRSLAEAPASAQSEAVIAACAGIKAALVAEDEFDTGSRRLLNFGHTLGHAAEACSGFRLRHGEAVAMGMAAVSRAAASFGLCGGDVPAALIALLRAYGLPTELPAPAEALAEAALRDKKADADGLRLVVPERIGFCRVTAVSPADLREWIVRGAAE